MALTKKIELSNGIVCNYHRISIIHIIPEKDVFLKIASYLTEEARRKSPVPVHEDEINFSWEEISDAYKNDTLLKKFYELLKKLPLFDNAEDC